MLVAAPILAPLIFALILISVKRDRISAIIGIAGSMIILAISLILFFKIQDESILVMEVGGWKAPYGITLVIDMLSVLMLVVTAIIVITISIYAVEFLDDNYRRSKFYFFFFTLVMGVNGAFITGDIFNLYVWFEVMLLSSFVLITLGSRKNQLEGGIKYMALNLIGSLLFLAGIGLLYGKTGTLNMAHLAQILSHDKQAIMTNTSAILFFMAFGIKAAVFPLFFWLPASYHTANITIGSLFAGLLTKVGVYAFLRFLTLFFVQDKLFWQNIILITAGLTMVVGGMAASSHYDTRRILSYHIISQIGYMIMGLGIFTPLALAGAIFFTIHNMLAKTNTFLVAGMIAKIKGSFYLKDVGGLFKQSPFLAILFIIPAFALAGVPPLSGFFAKLMLIKAGFDDGKYLITAVAIFTGLLTLYSMIKIWNEAFLKKQPETVTAQNNIKKLKYFEYLPSVILGLASVFMGLFAARFFALTIKAASQLTDPMFYIENVLK